jgi:anti-anti-sigma regulatory factor
MTTIATMTSPSRRVAVLAPIGPLGLDDCSALRAALREAAEDGARLVVLDLLDVTGLQPPVVEVLVGAAARCRALGARFVVANADRQPWTALTHARLAGVLRLHRRGAEPLADLLQLLEL